MFSQVAGSIIEFWRAGSDVAPCSRGLLLQLTVEELLHLAQSINAQGDIDSLRTFKAI